MGKAQVPNSGKIPDARQINRDLDIRLVAAALEIRRSGSRFHCWRPENHRNGDADPSVGYWAAANRLKCFVCGRPAIGVIDLVMDARDMDFVSAIVWIESRFDIPWMPVRKPDRGERRYLDAITHPIDYLVRSHIFGQLSPPAQSVATTVVAFGDHNGPAHAPWTVTISYRALMRYTGIRSPSSVRKALCELEMIGWLRAHTRRTGLLKATGAYVITPFGDAIVELGHKLARDEHMAIEYERAAAERRRVLRIPGQGEHDSRESTLTAASTGLMAFARYGFFRDASSTRSINWASNQGIPWRVPAISDPIFSCIDGDGSASSSQRRNGMSCSRSISPYITSAPR